METMLNYFLGFLDPETDTFRLFLALEIVKMGHHFWPQKRTLWMVIG